jgi:hypothetical protein
MSKRSQISSSPAGAAAAIRGDSGLTSRSIQGQGSALASTAGFGMRLAPAIMLSLIVGLNVILAEPAQAQKIFKYQDKDGNTIYSQSLPHGVTGEELKPRIKKVTSEEAEAQLKQLGERARTAGRTREQNAEIAAQDSEADSREKANCEQANKNLTILKSAARVQTTDARGNLVFLTEEAQSAKLSQAQAQVKRYCK